VTNYAAKRIWDSVIRDGGFDYLVHTAALLVDDLRLRDFESDFLVPNVDG
jgi:hypothetical protein